MTMYQDGSVSITEACCSRCELCRLHQEHEAALREMAANDAELRRLFIQVMQLQVSQGARVGAVLAGMRAKKRQRKPIAAFYDQAIAAATEEGLRLLSPA